MFGEATRSARGRATKRNRKGWRASRQSSLTGAARICWPYGLIAPLDLGASMCSRRVPSSASSASSLFLWWSLWCTGFGSSLRMREDRWGRLFRNVVGLIWATREKGSLSDRASVQYSCFLGSPKTACAQWFFYRGSRGGGIPPPRLEFPPLEKFPLNAIRLWHSSKPRRLTIPPTTTNLT